MRSREVVRIATIFVLISTIACTSIYKEPMSSAGTVLKSRDLGYQRVFILTNYGQLPPDEFIVYALNRASFYKWTKIRFFWMKMLGGQAILREAVIYYE